MRFTFAFFLANGTTELLTFTASSLRAAFEAAFAFSRVAFGSNELLDFEWRP